MAAYFFDTSALAKRWIRESGTDWVREATSRRAGNQILLARLALPEVASALAGRQRAGDVEADRVARAVSVLRSDLALRYTVVELTPDVLDRAASLALVHPIRSADAIHLAAACLVRDAAAGSVQVPLEFVASDVRLQRAAAAEGFAVIDPAAIR